MSSSRTAEGRNKKACWWVFWFAAKRLAIFASFAICAITFPLSRLYLLVMQRLLEQFWIRFL
jgi:hypothetical protein